MMLAAFLIVAFVAGVAGAVVAAFAGIGFWGGVLVYWLCGTAGLLWLAADAHLNADRKAGY